MVLHNVFGVERDIDIAANVFPSEKELAQLEAPLGEHEHGWFDSSTRPAKLHTRAFLPPGDKLPKAVVVFLCGVTAHSGEAFETADGRKTCMALIRQVFNAANIAVHSFDYYGHGYSEGSRFFIPSYEANVQDSLTFIRAVDERYDGKVPVFIMGISYGGNMAIQTSRRIQNDPSLGPKQFVGAILWCPAVIGDLPPWPVVYTLRYFLAPLFPKWIPFFMPNPISADRIWKDPEILAMRTDARLRAMNIIGTGTPYKLGTAVALLNGLEDVHDKAIPGFTVPYFLAHGTDDHGVKIEGSEYMWRTAATPAADRVFHHIEGAYHDLFSLEDSQKYFQMAVEWMEQRIQK